MAALTVDCACLPLAVTRAVLEILLAGCPDPTIWERFGSRGLERERASDVGRSRTVADFGLCYAVRTHRNPFQLTVRVGDVPDDSPQWDYLDRAKGNRAHHWHRHHPHLYARTLENNLVSWLRIDPVAGRVRYTSGARNINRTYKWCPGTESLSIIRDVWRWSRIPKQLSYTWFARVCQERELSILPGSESLLPPELLNVIGARLGNIDVGTSAIEQLDAVARLNGRVRPVHVAGCI